MSSTTTTTVIPPSDESSSRNHPNTDSRLVAWILHRDRLWLLLVLLILTALSLGGCSARADGCHIHASCGSAAEDSVLAAFYVVYIVGWIIVSCAGG
jgi:hypothetical protein